MKILTKQDMNDMLMGCTILGTGGGGEISEGLELINEAIALNKEFIMIGVDEVPDEAIIVTPYYLGAISEIPEGEIMRYKGLPKSAEEPILKAVNRIEEYIGKKIFGTIACETGGSNTAVPMYVAAMKNGYILDADIAGRAVPEVTNSTYYINGLPASPIVASNEFGEVAIFENIKDDARAEDILRALAMVSKNDVAAVDHALEMKILKNSIISGTLTKALNLGIRYREAKAAKANVAYEIAKAAGGVVAFVGVIDDFIWQTIDGFTIGSFTANGNQNSSGDYLKVWFKNENLMSWINEEVFVSLPDLICVIDTDTNEPITNPNYKKNMNIAVVIYPAPEVFKTIKGLEAFGPRRFGFDIDYLPAIGRVRWV